MSKKYLDYNGLSYFWGKIKTHIYDHVYPIGSFYQTMLPPSAPSGETPALGVNYFDPAEAWGGTWIQLHGRFLVAEGSNGASGGEALNLSAGASGGKKTVTLTAENMPYHRHALGQLTTETYAGFKPSLQVCNVATGSTSTSDNPLTYAGANRGTSGKNNAYTGASNTGGSHSHKLTAGQYTNYAGGSNGAATAHENLPPYLAVYMWERTA